MSHQTPPETTLEIRSASTTNMAALDSVLAQLNGQMAHVEAWPATPAKGRLRDALERVKQAAVGLRTRLNETVRMSNLVLEMFGQEDDPDPPQPPIVWSTGAW